MIQDPLEQAFALLQEETGVAATEDLRQRLREHAQLVRRWNALAGLVSAGDVALIETQHQPDALSLAPYVLKAAGERGAVLDIGSGGGFPILPLLCCLPGLRATLIERNARKVGFLHKAAAVLGLQDLTIIHGSFPEYPDKVNVGAITARAVEQPRKLLPEILKRLPQGGAFLCQTDPSALRSAHTFHVEPIRDAWRRAALRRGELYIITRR